ncbi:hypothetical protein QZH41_005837 [Actinostola sp. cb2023]|nr:hypothetical protein QZH41_005837 [Actinostola sp. cb2023]
MEQLQKSYLGAVADKDRVLRDHFVENLRDSQLWRDIRWMMREHSGKTFHELRDEARRSLEEGRPRSMQVVAREEKAGTIVECSQASGFSSKAIQDLVAEQKLLTESLQQQQTILTETQAALSLLTKQVNVRKERRCFHCNDPSHIRPECPKYKEEMAALKGAKPSKNRESSNSNPHGSEPCRGGEAWWL